MLVKSEFQITSFYAVLSDPNNPSRGFDYHVNYIEIKTYDDGSVVKSQEYQCNSSKALELGLALPVVMGSLNLSTAARAEELQKKAEQDREELEREKSEKAAILSFANQAAVSLQAAAEAEKAWQASLDEANRQINARDEEIAALLSAAAQANVPADQPQG